MSLDAESAEPPGKRAIRAAAACLFVERGYASTPVRDIAAAAGVDAALVIRYFGSKERLFLETMSLHLDNSVFSEAPLERLGEEFIRSLLGGADELRGVFLALIRASDAGRVGTALRTAHEAEFVAPLLTRLSGADAELRARLAAALVAGLLYSLWIAGDEALLALDDDELVRRYGALLQALVTPDR